MHARRGSERSKIIGRYFGREAAEGLGSIIPLKGGLWTQPAAMRSAAVSCVQNAPDILDLSMRSEKS